MFTQRARSALFRAVLLGVRENGNFARDDRDLDRVVGLDLSEVSRALRRERCLDAVIHLHRHVRGIFDFLNLHHIGAVRNHRGIDCSCKGANRGGDDDRGEEHGCLEFQRIDLTIKFRGYSVAQAGV